MTTKECVDRLPKKVRASIEEYRGTFKSLDCFKNEENKYHAKLVAGYELDGRGNRKI